MSELDRNLIRKYRKAKGLTQSQLAKIIGVTQQAVAKWEAGTAEVGLRYISSISKALNIPKEEIFPNLAEPHATPILPANNGPLPQPNEIPIPDRVKDAAALGNLAFFVGNGLSRLYGAPSWEELSARMLEGLAREKIIDHNKVALLNRQPLKTRISIADYYFKLLLEQGAPNLTYQAALKGYSKDEDSRHAVAYDYLAKCGVKFITTNYDRFLRRSLEKNSRAKEVMRNIEAGEETTAASTVKLDPLETTYVYNDPYQFTRGNLLNKNVLFHLHGSIDDERTIISSTQSYLNLYSNENVQIFLRAFFEDHIVVFIGYGLEELELLDLVIRAGHPKLNQKEPAKFFLLLPLLSHEADILTELSEYYRRLNIKLIPFSRDQSNFESYGELLQIWSGELAKLAKKPTRIDDLNLIDDLILEFEERKRPDSNVIGELMPLIEKDDRNFLYFIHSRKEPRWFPYLNEAGFFSSKLLPQPIKTEGGYTLPLWPQANYLGHIAGLIRTGEIKDEAFITAFLQVFRQIDSVASNSLVARALFLALTKVPTAFLSSEDVQRAFNWIVTSGGKDTLTESAVHEGLSSIIETTQDEEHQLEIFGSYLRSLLSVEIAKKDDSYHEPKLMFFSDYGLREFERKYFRVTALADAKPYVLTTALQVISSSLETLVSRKRTDQATQYWRPAVESHHQNNFHNSAPSILLGLLYSVASELLRRNIVFTHIVGWKTSPFFTFKRLYFALATAVPTMVPAEEAGTELAKFGLKSECRHEIFAFLKLQFGNLSPSIQNEILKQIEAIREDSSEEPEIRRRYAAWEKLRWLEAISPWNNETANDLRRRQLELTEDKTPDHPDFNSYMSGGWVGEQSPVSVEDLSKMTSDEIVELLLTFEEGKDYNSPTILGLSRTLERFVPLDPVKCSAIVKIFPELKNQYISAILDGYSVAWNEKKYVPVEDLISAAFALLSKSEFSLVPREQESKSDWVLGSIARFIETGTRNDENAFPLAQDKPLQELLSRSIELSPPDERYDSQSDSYSRAINEPRGKLFEAAIVLALRRARTSPRKSRSFYEAWDDLEKIIGPKLERKSDSEVSLYAMLGANFRQISFLNKDWIYKNIDLVVPPRSQSTSLWRSFMDGFCYVSAYVPEMYRILREKGILLAYLREEHDEGERKLDRLRERIIELSLVAYVVGHEEMTEGIIGAIVGAEDPDEWRFVISSIDSILGEKPKPLYLQRAKLLMARLIELRELSPQREDLKKAFGGVTDFLKFLEDPTDPLVKKVFQVKSQDTIAPWGLDDLVEYLHKFRESHPATVGELFVAFLAASNSAPTWPKEEIREICESLLKHSQTKSMIDICRFYGDRSFSCEPIRDICETLKGN